MDDEMPHYTGPMDPANRNIVGAVLSLVGSALMALAALLLFVALNNPALAFKFEAGSYPPDSGSGVHSAQIEVVAASVSTVLSTILALAAVNFRSATAWRVIGGLTFLALTVAGPALFFTFTLAF